MNSTATRDRAAAVRRAAVVEAAALRRCFRKPSKLTVTEWADRYRYLSPEASSAAVEAGGPVPFSSDLTPYQRRATDALSDPRVKTVVLMWPSQVGKTEVLNNFIGKRMDLEPGPMLVIQPTLQMAEAWSKDRLAPMLRDTPALRGKVKDARARDSDNTILHKKFPGGHLTIAGANSPAGLASRPIRDILCDEVDRYDSSAGTEGDPIGLAFRRGSTFRNGKRLLISSPTIKGKSRIEREYQQGTCERWEVPCPHCGHYQMLRWGTRDSSFGIKWEDGKPETAHYVCDSCACVVEDKWRRWMNERGAWVAEHPERVATVSLWKNALSSPWKSWGEYVEEFLKVKSDPDQLQQFVNTVLCETFELETAEIEVEGLGARAEEWRDAHADRIEVPAGVGILTAFADVQGDRVEVEVKGWGVNEESWMIAHHRIYGDIGSDPSVTQRMDAIRTRLYRHESGVMLRIAAFGVDSGDGVRVNEIYDYVRSRQREGVHATKGQPSRQREPIRRAAKPDKNGIRRVDIGTFPMKSTLFKRLTLTLEPTRATPPGYIHFRAADPPNTDDPWHNGADAEFYAQFGREKAKRKRQPNGEWVTEYIATGRNEAIDLEVGNLAMLHVLGPAVRANLEAWVATMQEAGRRARTNEAPAAQRRRRGPRVLSKGVS